VSEADDGEDGESTREIGAKALARDPLLGSWLRRQLADRLPPAELAGLDDTGVLQLATRLGLLSAARALPRYGRPIGVSPAEQAPVEEKQPEKDDRPSILFLRGPQVCPCQGRLPDALAVTRVAQPLPARVVGLLHRIGGRPLSGELVAVRVVGGTPPPTNVTIRSAAASVTLPLESRAGAKEPRKRLLLWYGSAGDLDGARWDDIELLDVSSGGGVPFGLEVTASCDGAEAKLGVVDVLIADPDGGAKRTARYGLFRTRKPSITFATPRLQTSQMRVRLDDGENDTPDELDVTRLVRLSGDTTELADPPEWVQLGSDCTGTVNDEVGCSRSFVECVDEPPEDGDTALFMWGANRIQLLGGDQLLFCAHLLNYAERHETIPAGYNPLASGSEAGGTTADVEGTGDAGSVVRGSLTLDFKDALEDEPISRVLHALRLRPYSYTGEFRIVEGRSHDDLDVAGLVELREGIEGHHLDALESLSLTAISPADPDEHDVLESIPSGLHADFSAANLTFTNASMHWHHFVIHTFPALRLIEHVLLPEARPPMVAVGGVQFETNKTFIRHGAADAIAQILHLDQEQPGRKIAIFGHTDTVGTTSDNDALSLRRAQSMEALLRHRFGFWYDRFEPGHEAVGGDLRDQQWALHELGQYAGPIDGNDTDDFENAVHAFQSSVGRRPGRVDGGTRTAMGDALRAKIGATLARLAHEQRWGTREIQSMLKRLGHYGGEINGAMNAQTREAVKVLQRKHGLADDGEVGVASRIAMIQDYMQSLVSAPLADARFHPNAVFGCGEAYPRVPTADEVESPQNRRVEAVFRSNPIEPIDPTRLGAACPYLAWLGPDVAPGATVQLPKVVVAVGDSGLGLGTAADNYSGPEQLTQPNRVLIKGERLIRPTDVTGAKSGNPKQHTVFQDGNLTGVQDGTGHGSSVITCMAADGVGDLVGGAPRNVSRVVVGTAPHVKVRPIRKPNNLFNNMLALEVTASDPDVFVYSTSSHLYRASFATPPVPYTAQQFRALEQRLQDMVLHGKLAIASAGNYRAPVTTGPPANQSAGLPGEYDTATREFGRQAPDRRASRSNAAYSGAHQHRRNIAIIGSTARVAAGAPIGAPVQQETVASHTYLGEQVSVYMPGERIWASSPPGLGSSVGGGAMANGMQVGQTSGTSFATPMTAGVVGEILMLDPALRQPANLPRALEYVEATADPLPNVNPAGGSGAPANPRSADPGANAGGPPFGPQSPTAPSTYTNTRRVHYWKAVLAALNQGLSSEGRGANGSPDGFFTYCTLRDDGSTKWYGFEIRSHVANAVVWWKRTDGSFVLAQDGGAIFPNGRTAAAAWRTVDLYQLAANQPLPAYPWTIANFAAAGRRPFFLGQISVEKTQLAGYQSLVLHLPGVDPLDPEGAEGPPLLEIRVSDLPTLRNPAGAAAAPELWKQAIGTFAIFDDFVFHLTVTPQPLDHFELFVEDRRHAAGVGEALQVKVYAVDRFGFLTDPGGAIAGTTTISHNGTVGAVGAPNTGVFLNGAAAVAAGFPLLFGAGADPRGLARLSFQDWNAENVTLTVNGGGKTGTATIQVHPAGAHAGFQLLLRRRAGGADVVANPPRAGEPLEVEVQAIDADGITVTSFTGPVVLSVISGEEGRDGPPARGVHVKNAVGDAYSPDAFTHDYAAGDAGVFVFPLFDFTPGPLQLRATGGAISGQSHEVQVLGGALAALRAQASSPQTAGTAFDVVVTALDANGNLIEDFSGAVVLTVAAGTPGAVAADGTRSGVMIGSTATKADDSYTFTAQDGGSHAFPITCFTTEVVRLHALYAATTGPLISADTAPITIQASALDHFNFDAKGAGRAGTAFMLEVSARDAANHLVPSFTGNVTLALAAGTPYAAAPPPPRGVLIETAPGVPGNVHAFASGDNGAFSFRITPNTAESISFTASSGAVNSPSAVIAIRGGAFDHFQIVPAAARANVPFNVTVTAMDSSNNPDTTFVGTVTLSVNTGGPLGPAANVARTFTAANNGVVVFTVTLPTSGAGRIIQASDGSTTTSQSAPFNVAP